jgi:hypothetical protein
VIVVGLAAPPLYITQLPHFQQTLFYGFFLFKGG